MNSLGLGMCISLDENGKIASGERADEIAAETIRRANLVVSYSKNTDDIMYARQALVHLYCALGRYDEAEAEACRFPVRSDFTRCTHLAVVNDCRGDFEVEISNLCTNLDYNFQTFEDSTAMLGKALIKAGRAADAAELFERYFEAMQLIFKGECRPPYHDFDSGDCYLLLAAAYIELGERERAVKCVEESVLYYRQLFSASDDGTAKISPESPFVKASMLCRRLSKEAVREKLRRKLASAELDALRDEPEFRRIAGLIEEI